MSSGNDLSEEEYAVESILDHRTIRQGRKNVWKIQYLIKWEGYSNEYNTWEAEDNVFADSFVAAYWVDKGGSAAIAALRKGKPLPNNAKKNQRVRIADFYPVITKPTNVNEEGDDKDEGEATKKKASFTAALNNVATEKDSEKEKGVESSDEEIVCVERSESSDEYMEDVIATKRRRTSRSKQPVNYVYTHHADSEVTTRRKEASNKSVSYGTRDNSNDSISSNVSKDSNVSNDNDDNAIINDDAKGKNGIDGDKEMDIDIENSSRDSLYGEDLSDGSDSEGRKWESSTKFANSVPLYHGRRRKGSVASSHDSLHNTQAANGFAETEILNEDVIISDSFPKDKNLNWETAIERVEYMLKPTVQCKETENQVILRWKDDNTLSMHPLYVVHAKCPLKLIHFYENKLRHSRP